MHQKLLSAGLLHGTVIEDLALVALNEAFCLPVKIKEWAGEGFDCAHRADTGTAEGTADALFESWTSLVIEKRHCYIVKSVIDKIELTFKGNSMMVCRKGAVRRVGLAVSYLPVRNKLSNGALSSLALVVKYPRNGIP